MPFEALLRQLVSSIDGADGAIFSDSDGEAVQWWAEDDGQRLRLRAAYAAVMLQAFRASTSQLKLGGISSLILHYDGGTFILEELDSTYFILLELNASANIGQALYRLGPAVANLRREIAA